MSELTNGCCAPTEGSLYPALKDFKENGYLTSEKKIVNGRERKIYKLTEKGLKAYQTLSNKNTLLSHFLASIFGAITPFCSCSTIPMLVGMINTGVPFGISMTFLLASPLANYVAIIMLAGLLGWKIAFLYVLLILIISVIGGLTLKLL
ncbi:MAG: permease [Halanaerobiales bacterium]